MAFRSKSQLRNETWPTREAAVKALKSNAFPEESADHYVGEKTPGSGIWQILDRENASAENVVPINTGKRKSALTRIKTTRPDQDSAKPSKPAAKKQAEVPIRSAQDRKAPNRVERGRKREPRQSGQGTNRARCATLLLRKEGAKLQELTDIIGRQPSMSFIRKLAGIYEKDIETLGDKHWRLVDKKS